MTIEIEQRLRGARLEAETEAAASAARRFALRAASEGVADITYTTIHSPLGELLLAATRRGLVRIAYVDGDSDLVLEDLVRRISPRVVEASAFLDPVRRELDEYFAGRRRHFDAPLDWKLIGGFGRRVLRATVAVPYGSVSSYAGVARRAGSPAAARAAGNALGANPMPIVIPCHRILHSGGGLGGYTGGIERKRYLLELEGTLTARIEGAP
jgi:methylated-DNA-[protein]-cysteine S-methyltransferase